MENNIRYLTIFLVLWLFLLGCKNSTKNRKFKALNTITLISSQESNNINKHLDSIVLKYWVIDTNIQRVQKYYYIGSAEPICVSYIIHVDNAFVLAGLDNVSVKQFKLYLSFKDSITHYFSFPTQKYMDGGLKYVRKESVILKGHKAALFVFFGNDIGLNFSNAVFVYFDENNHIRQIKSKNGELLFRDKNW